MQNKFAIIICIVNFIKASASNSRLFAKLCKDMDSNHKNLLFHIYVRWLCKLKCDSTAKDDFEATSLNDFWAKYLRMYKNVGSVTIRTLLPFSFTYLCESGFLTLVSVKAKSRNKLECEADLRCALSSTKPRIKLLVFSKTAASFTLSRLRDCKLVIIFSGCIFAAWWGVSKITNVKEGLTKKVSEPVV